MPAAFRLATSPARDYLNSSFNETPTSQAAWWPTSKIVLDIAEGPHRVRAARLALANRGGLPDLLQLALACPVSWLRGHQVGEATSCASLSSVERSSGHGLPGVRMRSAGETDCVKKQIVEVASPRFDPTSGKVSA
jgi:hypothetical protein